MTESRRFALAPGLLAVFLVTVAAQSGAAGGSLDSPETKLRARIANLHAEVALLEVECAAAKHNLLESLKKTGQLELGDQQSSLSKIKDELRQVKMAGRLVNQKELLEEMSRDSEKSGNKEKKEEIRLAVDFLKGGEAGDKALEHLAEFEFKARLDSSRAESARMKSDFLKKCRQLHQMKLDLADAEAEYKVTK
jgi:hypothetical protein